MFLVGFEPDEPGTLIFTGSHWLVLFCCCCENDFPYSSSTHACGLCYMTGHCYTRTVYPCGVSTEALEVPRYCCYYHYVIVLRWSVEED